MIANGSHFTVSVIDYGTSTDAKPIDLQDALEPIGNGRWRGAIQKIRAGYKAAGGGEIGKKAMGRQKLQLAGILFSGTFTHRSKGSLIQHSGLICCDLDNLGDRTASIKEAVTHDPCVLAAFLSPTGEGLKVVLRCDPTRKHEEETYPAAHLYMLEKFGVDIDDSCSDVSRICFVSDDPDIYIADRADCIPYPEAIKPVEYDAPAAPVGQSQGDRPGDDYNARADIPALLRSHGWTPTGKTGWRRPEKDWGLSATFGYYPGFFHVFTSSTQFEPNRTYRPFQVYAILECSGDFREAARKLGRLGYGEQRSVGAPLPNPMPQKTGIDLGEDDGPPAATPVQKTETREERTLRLLISSRFSPDQIIPKPTPIFTAAGTTICTPGNLTALYSQAKAGKTAAIGGMLAATMQLSGAVNDTLGFQSSNPDGKAVVHFDTEQSRYDWQQMILTATRRAKLDRPKDWLCSHTLTGLTVAESCMVMDLAMSTYAATYGGIHCVFIDGVGDMVADVNEPKECNELIAKLHGLAIAHDCAIILILHLNPTSEVKGRGHLGSQLQRKVESNLMLEKNEEGVTRLYATQQRGKMITKENALCFQWSEEEQMHVSVKSTPPVSVKGGRPKKYTLSRFADFMPREKAKAATFRILFKLASDKTGIKETAFRDLVNEAEQKGEVIQVLSPGGYVYYLNVPGQV